MSHRLSYVLLCPTNRSTTSGAMNSAEPTGESRSGVDRYGISSFCPPRSKSQIFTWVKSSGSLHSRLSNLRSRWAIPEIVAGCDT